MSRMMQSELGNRGIWLWFMTLVGGKHLLEEGNWGERQLQQHSQEIKGLRVVVGVGIEGRLGLRDSGKEASIGSLD